MDVGVDLLLLSVCSDSVQGIGDAISFTQDNASTSFGEYKHDFETSQLALRERDLAAMVEMDVVDASEHGC